MKLSCTVPSLSLLFSYLQRASREGPPHSIALCLPGSSTALPHPMTCSAHVLRVVDQAR